MQPQSDKQSLIQAFRQLGRISQIVVGIVLLFALVGLGSLVKPSSGNTSASGGSPTATSQRASGPTATPAPTHAPTATPKPKAWTTIKHFSGSANQQTDTFHIPDGAHIVWKCASNDSYGGGNFIVTLYASDGSELDLIANTSGNDSGTYTLHDSGGSYYLNVSTFSENWTIDIQVYQ